MMAAAMTRVEAKRSLCRSSTSRAFALFISPMQYSVGEDKAKGLAGLAGDKLVDHGTKER